MPVLHDPTAIADVEAVEPVLLGQLGLICMTVGMNTIANEADAREFYRRVNIMEKLTGANRTRVKEDESGIEPVYLTPEEARSLIGYRTNASPMTKAKFRTHALDVHERFLKF
jgi:hypothetical protein